MTVSAFATPAATLIFAFSMVHAGVTDLVTMKIRNGVVLLLFIAYLALAPFAGFPLHEIGWSVAIAAGVLAGGFALFAAGWIGGGDAKLAAVTALWLGADHTPAYLLYATLFGGALTLALLLFRAAPLPAMLHGRPWLAQLHANECGVPYGVAMALAALVVFPHTRWMTTLL